MVSMTKSATQWETLARTQRIAARLALQEQQDLQEAIELNRSFIIKMTALHRKRPRPQDELATQRQG
ncbi:hypothetical protein AC1031_002160 [Aphanomyces cochlioides]|nr:hypothetical protein AC1031_002160 [Aphanomyces cochlioides]